MTFQVLFITVIIVFCHQALVKAAPAANASAVYNANRSKPVACYYYGWAVSRPSPMNYDIQDINTDFCSEIMLAYAGVDRATGEIKSVIPEYIADEGRYRRLTSIKRPSVSVLLSVGGWVHGGPDIANMANDANKRKNFVNSAVSWMQKYNFDGLDIYWLYPGVDFRGGSPRDKTSFVTLLKELRQEFSKRNLLLTAAIPTVQYYLEQGYLVRELSEQLDWINVISFDLRGQWKGVTDVHSPLNSRSIDEGEDVTLNVRDGLRRLVRMGAPREKLMVGIPFYGRSYTLKDKNRNGLHAPINPNVPAKPGPFVQSNELLAYYEICSNLQGNQWRREFDAEGVCPYAVYDDQWVGYEDEESISHKVDFVVQEEFRGVMVFNNDMDDFRGVCGQRNSLLTTINLRLGNGSPGTPPGTNWKPLLPRP